MTTATRSTLLAMVLFLAGHAAATAGPLGGIGVLGDSYSDEYEFYPPDRRMARNWVEILATVRGLDFGRFDAASRAEPRNQGYAYNWARSDATTDDMIRTGQHTGLAAQVARGEVDLAVIFIGGNDFINALKGPAPLSALRATLPRALANHGTAVRTILAASPRVKLVLVTLPDIRHLPEFDGPIRAGRLPTAVADAFTLAIATYNARLRSLAAGDPRIALLDLDMATRCANLVSRDHVLVGGRRLDRCRTGNDLDCFFLADVRHPGTLGQGLMASMFVEVVNREFDAGIAPLVPGEILVLARSIAKPGQPDLRLAKREGSVDPHSAAALADREGPSSRTVQAGR